MDNIQTHFSINDLENLTGIKAHTIRKWEMRFQLLNPHRTDNNFRRYDLEDLKRLLNISLLYSNGHKISQLASFSEQKLLSTVNELVTRSHNGRYSISNFKLAMLNFDRYLFEDTYSKLFASFSFSEIFTNIFVPFLDEIGKLWQTGSICPAQEHFISNLIRQKLFLNIEKLSYQKPVEKRLYVLFLPFNELHELGLLFLHYKLLLSGKNSVYLGQSMEVKDLAEVKKTYKEEIVYVTQLTLAPGNKVMRSFLKELTSVIIGKNDKVWISGGKMDELRSKKQHNKIEVFENLQKLFEKI